MDRIKDFKADWRQEMMLGGQRHCTWYKPETSQC